MKPSEYAAIMADTFKAFESWCEENKADSKDKKLLEAFVGGENLVLVEFGKVAGDRLYSDGDSDEKIPEGEGISTYLKNALDLYVENLSASDSEDSEQNAQSLTQISFEKYQEETFKLILVLMSAYSGKEIKTMDEDDGIEGEESEMRHQIFDSFFGAIAAVKSGVMSKEKVARTCRALADFFESM